MAEVKIHDRGVKKDAVDEVEDAADAGEKGAGIFDAGFAFENGFDEVADNCGEAQDDAKDRRVEQGHAGEFGRCEMGEGHADAGGDDDGAAEAFPGFAGADARDHFVFADEGAGDVSAEVAEFGDENKIENVVGAVPLEVREVVYFLDEVEQVRDIHQAEQCGGNGDEARGAGFGNELAHAQPKDEEDQEGCFEIVDVGWPRGRSPASRDVKERASHEKQAGEDAEPFEAKSVFVLEEIIELDEASPGERHHDDEENVVGEEFVAGEKRGDDDGPKDDRAEQAAQEDDFLRGARRFWGGRRIGNWIRRFGHAWAQGISCARVRASVAMREQFDRLGVMIRWLLLITIGASSLLAMDRAAADAELKRQWEAKLAALQAERASDMASNVITLGTNNLRWMEKVFGEAPAKGHSLWISMHGGGGAPKRLNDQQWTNQIKLYQLEEGIYVAPRAPTDNWNLWHEAHIDPMFDRLIEDYVALRGVDPDRVYIMGYSAGGDGVWQLAPRMADRWAAAAMMAGHPNEASLLGLRNLPIALFVGGEDAAYHRNEIVPAKGKELDALEAADAGGYPHMLRVYPGLPHWMNHKDAEAIPWMAKYTRQAWPKKVVWFQDDVTHTRFYWLAIPEEAAQEGKKIVAEVKGQKIELNGDVPKGMTLRLSDELVNLDEPLHVAVDGKEVFAGKVERSGEAIRKSLNERADPRTAAKAVLTLQW